MPGIKNRSDGLNKPLVSSILSPAIYSSKPISTDELEVSQNHNIDEMIVIQKSFDNSLRSPNTTDRQKSVKYSYTESDSETSEKDRTITETEEEVFQFELIPGSPHSHLQTGVEILNRETKDLLLGSFNQSNVQIRHYMPSYLTEHLELKPIGINRQNIWKPENQIDESKKRMSDARLSFTASILNDPNTNSSGNIEEQPGESSFDSLPVNEFAIHTKAQFPTYNLLTPYYYDSSPQFVQEVRV